MVIAALIAFAALFVAWLLAPADRHRRRLAETERPTIELVPEAAAS
jgi:hypothetical protein